MVDHFMDKVGQGVEFVVLILHDLYALIFPEYPDIGLIIVAVALTTVLVQLLKIRRLPASLMAGVKIFLSLTVLACFIHFVIILFLMLQKHLL